MKNIVLFMGIFPLWWGNALDPTSDRLRAISQSRVDEARRQVILEDARRQRIDNDMENYKRIESRWKIKDEYNNRQLKKVDRSNDIKKVYLDKKEKYLQLKEREFIINQKEQDLRDRGVLPAKKPSRMIINGKEFMSYDEFKKSPEYQIFLQEAATRQALEKQELEEENQKSYVHNKDYRIRNDIQYHVKTDPLYRIKRGEKVSFDEWPDHWKKGWKTYTSKKYH